MKREHGRVFCTPAQVREEIPCPSFYQQPKQLRLFKDLTGRNFFQKRKRGAKTNAKTEIEIGHRNWNKKEIEN